MDVGDMFKTNEGYNITILSDEGFYEVTILFETGNTKVVSRQNIKTGSIKNLLHMSRYGVGFLGEGSFTGKHDNRAYSVWSGMLSRCYYKKDRCWGRYGGKGVYVIDDWHNFQNFAEWFYKQPYAQDKSFHLDKDLTMLGASLYSPATCCLLPASINTLLTSNNASRGTLPVGVKFYSPSNKYISCCREHKGGQVFLGYHNSIESAFSAYKSFKEGVIRKVASHHYSKGNINNTVYNNLMNWEVKEFPL